MKTSINQGNEAERQNGYTPERLSVKDALIWFIITVAALCLAGTSNAGTPGHSIKASIEAPVAQDITMEPIVQASSILPFVASSANSIIGTYTVVTVPPASQGILSIGMNGSLMAVSEGMMLTADLAGSLSFEPNASYDGDVVFTYTASDEEGLVSNIAVYTIPVSAKPQIPLPLSLLSFAGAAENKKAVLSWQTTNETCCSHYELQRSSDGKNFEPVATITAKITPGTSQYLHTDDLFFFLSNTVYYRLKIIGINGSFRYSSQVTISLKTANAAITAWPMPFNNQLNVQYNSEENGNVKMIIRNINGGELLKMNAIVKKGNNSIFIYQAQTLPAGTYLLTLSNGAKAATIKVAKQ